MVATDVDHIKHAVQHQNRPMAGLQTVRSKYAKSLAGKSDSQTNVDDVQLRKECGHSLIVLPGSCKAALHLKKISNSWLGKAELDVHTRRAGAL